MIRYFTISTFAFDASVGVITNNGKGQGEMEMAADSGMQKEKVSSFGDH